MEKLCQIIFSRRALRICILFYALNSYSQDHLVVFSYAGEPFYEVNDSIKPITKGTLLDKTSKLTVNEGDSLTLISKDGKIIEVKSPRTFTFKELYRLRTRRKTSSFAQKYFNYVWKEFTSDTAASDDNTAVVYRGNNVILLQFPNDSVNIFMNKIQFSWDSIPKKEKDYYLFIKDLNTNKLYRKPCKDNFITVEVDHSELKFGTDYQWGISEAMYEEFDNLETFKFRLLSKEEFEEQKTVLKKLIKELLSLGLTEKEARKSICEVSKFCFEKL